MTLGGTKKERKQRAQAISNGGVLGMSALGSALAMAGLKGRTQLDKEAEKAEKSQTSESPSMSSSSQLLQP